MSQESTELVVERLSCPQKLESLNCKDSLLMKESATDSQQYLPSNVHKKSSTLLSRETTIHKVPTRRGSLSPIKLRKPQSHSRNLSLPAISVTTQITTSYAQNPIVENVPVKTDNIQKQIKLRRRASVPVSLQLISSKTPSCNRQKRPGSAMLTTDHTGGMFSLPQRRTLAPFENTASQFTNRQDTCISTSRCLNVDCQQIIATKDKIIATKDKIIRQKDLEIQRLQMRTLGLD